VITGKAPAGATLRLRKQFSTPTWESSFTDRLNSTMTVDADGRYAWHVNQSTRPVVAERLTKVLRSEPVRSRTYTGGTTTPATGVVDHRFTVTETGIDVMKVDLDWPTPDDLDLEVYRKKADGSLTLVGSSGNLPGEKESVLVNAPTPGTYVLRVINYASVSPTYTLTAALYEADEVAVPGLIENYTLTCERRGVVLEQRSIVVARGQQVKADLATCIRRANNGG